MRTGYPWRGLVKVATVISGPFPRRGESALLGEAGSSDRIQAQLLAPRGKVTEVLRAVDELGVSFLERGWHRRGMADLIGYPCAPSPNSVLVGEREERRCGQALVASLGTSPWAPTRGSMGLFCASPLDLLRSFPPNPKKGIEQRGLKTAICTKRTYLRGSHEGLILF